jgi:hypothetical protein
MKEYKVNYGIEFTDKDNDLWQFDCDGFKTKEEAIKKGIKIAKNDGYKHFRVGKSVPCSMATIYADNIIENAVEQLYEEVGEVSETYLEDVTSEQEKELEEDLNEVFYQWHKKHKLFPNCYTIEDIEYVEVDM